MSQRRNLSPTLAAGVGAKTPAKTPQEKAPLPFPPTLLVSVATEDLEPLSRDSAKQGGLKPTLSARQTPGLTPHHRHPIRLPTTESATFLPIRKENKEVQTDVSIYPEAVPSLAEHLDALEAREFQTLKQLRQRIAAVMSEVGGSIYDLFSFKDVMLAMRSSLPGAPLTDLLLLSSKLFRRGSELSRLLTVFFNICFADDFTDEHLHFTEIRHLKKQMAAMGQELQQVSKERDESRERFENLRVSSQDHVNALQALEDRNSALENRSAALEDRMALLFHQLTDDFLFYNENALARTAEDLNVHEKMTPARSAFSQSLEALHGRLKFFQTMLQEIQEDAAHGGSTTGEHGTMKSKMRALEVHIQHLADRFSAVREGLGNVAQELTAALLDKKKILNFSVHHLRAYEVQNHKLRAARAAMHDLRKQVSKIGSAITSTFPSGARTIVDSTGYIQRRDEGEANSGGTSAEGSPLEVPHKSTVTSSTAERRHAADTIPSLQGMITTLYEAAERITMDLSTEDEHRALMRTLALAVPSSTRDTSNLHGRDRPPVSELALVPFDPKRQDSGGNASGGSHQSAAWSYNNSFTIPAQPVGGASGPVAGSSAPAPQTAAMTRDQYLKLREDFAVKVTFLREVYEERIADLEEKAEQLQKKLTQHEINALRAGLPLEGQGREGKHSPGLDGPPSAPASPPLITGTVDSKTSRVDSTDERDKSPLLDATAEPDARALATRARERWQHLAGESKAVEQDQRHDATVALNSLQEQIADEAATRRPYVSPLYTQQLIVGLPRSGDASAPGAEDALRRASSLRSSELSGTPNPSRPGTAPRQLRATVGTMHGGVAGAQPLMGRTEHNRQLQARNAEVLRTLRKLAQRSDLE